MPSKAFVEQFLESSGYGQSPSAAEAGELRFDVTDRRNNTTIFIVRRHNNDGLLLILITDFIPLNLYRGQARYNLTNRTEASTGWKRKKPNRTPPY
jgi:hypothetical protein